ncbi:hypothetical protein AN219_22685 [Streptomyces nanshensis]|nr:hypothetical protein AN219_22685 [Streptomyces nanshensis]
MNRPRAKSPGPQGQPGELLISHLENTLKAVMRVRDRIGEIPGMPPDFWTWAMLAALLHDTGKLPDGFQRMIDNTPETPIIWGERHEVLSLGFVDLLTAHLPAEERLWIASVVAGHHRAFTCGLHNPRRIPVFHQYGDDQPAHFASRFKDVDPVQLTELLEWLHATSRRFHLPVVHPAPSADAGQLTEHAHRLFEQLLTRWEFSLPPGDPAGLTAVLLLGAVTMADHLSSANTPLETRHPLAPHYPARLAHSLATRGHELRPQQEQSARTAGHLLLRSWTGSGKTEAVLLWARAQIDDLHQRVGAHARVFYLLPYLASINAMVLRLEDDLEARGSIGVAHSKAADYHLARALADDCAEATDIDSATSISTMSRTTKAAKAHSRAQATKNFRELLRVGTPYQLLRGALAGPAHSGILTDCANSVFILDELHAYDTRRLGMILAMMRLWHDLGGRIAVMSATLPTVLEELVGETLDDQVSMVEAPAHVSAPARHRLETRRPHLTDDESLNEIRARLSTNQSVLVIANNVRDAIAIYRDLKPFCIQLHGENSAHLLHSRFRRMDRTNIEDALQDRFGAGQHPRQPGLLVGTQALEVSLNLDLDACHTSAADLEALIQRFGRVNRLGALAPAPVIVHQPTYTTRRNSGDALWADGVYEAEPTQRGWDILTRHDGQTVDERLVTNWLDDIYASPWGERWKKAVRQHKQAFATAFLDFAHPFDDRTDLANRFDEQFDGTEAVLESDLEKFEYALKEDKKAGRLLADDYLIPLPHWAGDLTTPERRLKVRIISGEYDDELGLTAIRPMSSNPSYKPGDVP